MDKVNSSLLNVFLGMGVATLGVYILIIGQAILVPLVIALLIAYFIVAIADAIGSVRFLGLSVFKPFAMLASIAIVFGALYLLFNVMLENANTVAAHAPAYQESLNLRLREIYDFFGLKETPTIANLINTLTNGGLSNADVSSLIQRTLGQVTGIAGNMFAVFIYTVFLIFERGTLKTKIAALARNPDQHSLIEGTLDSINQNVRRYLAVKSLASSLVATLSYAIMITIGIDFALFWAVLTFFFNFVPYIGSIVAVSFPILLTLVQPGFEDPVTTFLFTLVALIAAQQLVGSFIEPRLLGRTLNLSPLAILLSLAFWWAVWGVIGMFISIPIMVIFLIIFSQFESTRPIAILLSQRGEIQSVRQIAAE
jgi:predicted PurR-regulated permease PerM